MIKRKCSEIAAMLNLEFNFDKDDWVEGVCFDSRECQKNNLFIPLIGERVNGHHYALSAIEKGASCILWNEDELDPPEGVCVLKVKDTQKAFAQLAHAYWQQCSYPVVAITGSNGKTSTKDLIAGVLSQKFKVAKTMGNHNNEIGVPYTLLCFDEDIDVGVVEMGMENLHEIEQLCEIVQPDIGVITNVGTAHLENLGSIENIAKAKCELIDGMNPKGMLFYNGDDFYLNQEIGQKNIQIQYQTFGEGKENDIVLTHFHQDESKIEFGCADGFQAQCAVLGHHQALNALAAIGVARYLGMSDREIQEGFSLVQPTKWRTQLETVGQCRILNDSYKSNPQSAVAALKTFEEFQSPYKIVVFGDMLDLGSETDKIHEQLGKEIAHYACDEVFCIGECAQYILKGAQSAGLKGSHFDNREDLIEALLPYTEKDCMILIKGSRGLHLDLVVDALKEKVNENGKN